MINTCTHEYGEWKPYIWHHPEWLPSWVQNVLVRRCKHCGSYKPFCGVEVWVRG